MNSNIEIIPNTELKPGLFADQFLTIGVTTYKEAACYIRDLPYGRNSDRANYLLVIPEHRGACSTKHALLAALAREQGIIEAHLNGGNISYV